MLAKWESYCATHNTSIPKRKCGEQIRGIPHKNTPPPKILVPLDGGVFLYAKIWPKIFRLRRAKIHPFFRFRAFKYLKFSPAAA